MGSNEFKLRFYPEARFGGFSDVDGTVHFYTRVQALLAQMGPSAVVALDIGCGRGVHGEDAVPYRRDLTRLRGRCAKVIGIDVDPAGRENPLVDEFRLIENVNRWPVQDASVDFAVADTVLEHVEDPDAFFSEARRVLKVGGVLAVRTPNVMSYIGLVSSLVPNRLHARVLKKAQAGRKEEDVFPTLYRCNTRGRLRRTMRQHGFDPCVYGYEAEPSYFNFSRVLYALGVLHQKFAPNFLKVALFAFGRKLPDSPK